MKEFGGNVVYSAMHSVCGKYLHVQNALHNKRGRTVKYIE